MIARRSTLAVAALFLATGGAHAGMPHYYKCGDIDFYHQYFTGRPVVYKVSGYLPAERPLTIRLKWKRDWPYINGRRCIETDEDGKPIGDAQ
jgi:hypothetical protein